MPRRANLGLKVALPLLPLLLPALSGMAAISSALLNLCDSGDHIVASNAVCESGA